MLTLGKLAMIRTATGLGGAHGGVESAARIQAAETDVAPQSAWAPLRQPAFGWLWLGVVVSSVGRVMQTVGAQWLLLDQPNAASAHRHRSHAAGPCCSRSHSHWAPASHSSSQAGGQRSPSWCQGHSCALRPGLDLVNVNLSRGVGPALAGLVIAHVGGVPVVFALNALSVVTLAVALLFWAPPRARSPESRGALRPGTPRGSSRM